MKSYKAITICMTLFLALLFVLPEQALAQKVLDFDKLTTIELKVNSKTRYRIYYGSNKGELIIDVKRPPRNIKKQLASYLGQNLISIRQLSKSAGRYKAKLVISPRDFAFKHRRAASPQRIIIEIGYKLEAGESRESRKPLYPLVPFWEAVIDNTPLMPDHDFTVLKPGIDKLDRKNYLQAVEFSDMGAYGSAMRKIRDNLVVSNGPLWVENLTLLGDVYFKQAYRDNNWDTALRSVLAAEQENLERGAKIRMFMEQAYIANNRGTYSEAQKTFTAGAAEWRRLRTYFEIGLLENYLYQKRLERAEDLAKSLMKRTGLPVAAERKICFARATIQAMRGKIRKAGRMVDRCIKTVEQDEPSVAQYLMAAEVKFVSEQLGEAKNYYKKVIGLYPSHWHSSLALLRLGDLYAYENKFEEAVEAYRLVGMNWPASPYATLAGMRLKEYVARQAGDLNPMEVYEKMDLVGAESMLERDAKLRLMWHYHKNGQNEKAFAIMVDLYRRFDLAQYWVFQPKRLSAIVLDTYRNAFGKEDYQNIIKKHNAGYRFPLSKIDQEMISYWSAESFRYGLQDKEAVKVYLKELERKGHSPQGERRLLLGLTQAYISTGDHYRARMTQDYFVTRFKDTEDQRQHLLAMAEINKLSGAFKASLDSYSKALELTDKNYEKVEISCNMGRIYYRMKRYEQATEIYVQALAEYFDKNVEIEPELIPECVRHGFFMLADSQYQLNRLEDAQATYRRALKLFPYDSRRPVALYYDGEICAQAGRVKEAAKIFEELAQVEDEAWSRIGKLKVETAGWRPSVAKGTR